eukprot:CAMPEP_0194365242 /NCGR_PEP_ID=MMETSP0174-20130528/13242_1 /TAXON_ID=216777 /ORGANISM="Proboscia alata, Strain PI-D3" /LENGTH=1418 /DNA_ID=CAMNT_0039139787 /DNA_START=461 /DNA_END=4717 /DNA_ORIENTATION=+
MKELFSISCRSSRDDDAHSLFSWNPQGNFLAVASSGFSGTQIVDRQGEKVDEVPAICGSGGDNVAISWDSCGANLAVLQESNSFVSFWNESSQEVTLFDTNLRDPSFMKWSKFESILAIGTLKGNLLLYNHVTKRRIPIMGKHPGKIVSGVWNSYNQLVLVSEDGSLTVSNVAGDTLNQVNLTNTLSEISFVPCGKKGNELQQANDNILCGISDGASLSLFEIDNSNDLQTLDFDVKNGDIVSYEWVDTDFVIVGWSRGKVAAYTVLVNTFEIVRERWSHDLCDNNFTGGVSFSQNLKKITVFEEGTITIFNTEGNIEERLETNNHMHRICWSPDGNILSVATTRNNLFCYIASIPSLGAHSGSKLAYVSSLNQIAYVDMESLSAPSYIKLKYQPSLISIGPTHIAIGVGNRLVVYNHSNYLVEIEAEYNKNIEDISVNGNFAAILVEEQIVLQGIVANHNTEVTKICPKCSNINNETRVTSISLTDDFLLQATHIGTLDYFSLEEWKFLADAQLRHSKEITKIYPNKSGTRALFIDNIGSGHIYNPVSFDLLPLSDFPISVKCVMWDMCNGDVAVVYDGKELHTYVLATNTIHGPSVMKVGPINIDESGKISMVSKTDELDHERNPLHVHDGKISCQCLKTGTLVTVESTIFDVVRSTHDQNMPKNDIRSFARNVALLRLEDAWIDALKIGLKHYWLALANKSMQVMEVDLAIRIYRELGDAGMVFSLQQLSEIEDKHLLAGHLSLILMDDYDHAQALFLTSSKPCTAVDMRVDLMQWEQAVTLATSFAPERTPELLQKYGECLEAQGEYESSLRTYEMAVGALEDMGHIDLGRNIKIYCTRGIARTTLRLGNVAYGIQIVRDIEDKHLCCECASILVSMKQFHDAAVLYEFAGKDDEAAELFIKEKDKRNASRVMEKASSSHLYLSYGSLCEEEGDYKAAVDSYERGNDAMSVIRLCLGKLNDPEKAFSLVRTSTKYRSLRSGVKMVADYCEKKSNFLAAIEFWLISEENDRALELAKSNKCMDNFVELLKDIEDTSTLREVANYYNEHNDAKKAGFFFDKCGEYGQALSSYLKCGEIQHAIDSAGKANNDLLTHRMIDFLMGETDGQTKDPSYVYELYIALGKYADAAKTAIIIAKQYQEIDGDYDAAHRTVYKTINALESHNVPVPRRLREMFVTLHTFEIVKIYARQKSDDHEEIARLLLRVAKFASGLPQHKIRILISTVIECQKGCLRDSAREWATHICSSQDLKKELNRQPKKLKTKIQSVVRRSNHGGAKEKKEMLSACPISGSPIPVTQLECPVTKDMIPMCVCSGRHMELDDWCICPNSGLPALYSHYKRYIESNKVESSNTNSSMTGCEQNDLDCNISTLMQEGQYCAIDPVCKKQVYVEGLKLISPDEAKQYIRKYNEFGLVRNI